MHVGPGSSFVTPARFVCEVATLVCARRRGAWGRRSGVLAQLCSCASAAGLVRGSCVGPPLLCVGPAGLVSGLRRACVLVPFRSGAGSAAVVREPRWDCGPRRGSCVRGLRGAHLWASPGSCVGPTRLRQGPCWVSCAGPSLVLLGACLRLGRCAVAGHDRGWCVLGRGAGGWCECLSGRFWLVVFRDIASGGARVWARLCSCAGFARSRRWPLARLVCRLGEVSGAGLGLIRWPEGAYEWALRGSFAGMAALVCRSGGSCAWALLGWIWLSVSGAALAAAAAVAGPWVSGGCCCFCLAGH